MRPGAPACRGFMIAVSIGAGCWVGVRFVDVLGTKPEEDLFV
jgi:hypothetical protein